MTVSLVFYYTLIVMFIAALSASVCVSGVWVSRRKSFVWGIALFTFYFFDVSVVFLRDFMNQGQPYSMEAAYSIDNPILSLLMATGVFGCLWGLVCEKLGRDSSKALLVAPVVIFVVASTATYLLIPNPAIKCFAFFTCRQIFLFFIFGFYFRSYFKADATERMYIRPKPKFIAVALAFAVLILVEDAIVYFTLIPASTAEGSVGLHFLAERSIAENILFVWLGFVMAYDAWQTIDAHFIAPPDGENTKSVNTIERLLPRYCEKHGLSPREKEVLRMVLQGKDNRNIASEMTLAMSTVKVHVHNILRKTQAANRQELIQDFWKG